MSTAKALRHPLAKVLQVFVAVFALLMILSVMPTSARAAELNETQIQAVVNLLASFGASESIVANVNVALRGGTPGGANSYVKPHATSTKERRDGEKEKNTGNPACVTFARTLIKGHQGEDVKRLQEFLRETGDFREASTSSYFGPKTEAALRLWQMRLGIASSTNGGLGSFGPLTRGKIVSECMKLEHKRNATTTPPVTPPPTSTTTSGTSDVIQPSFASTDVGKSVILMTDGVLALSEGLSRNFSQHFSDVGDGMAAVISGYLSLFSL